MKITADTNVLVRAIVGDDEEQNAAAMTVLDKAELVAITIPALCEFVWVLRRVYKIPSPRIAVAMRRLFEAENVTVDWPTAEAGMGMLEAGGDFADGVIAFQGQWLGAQTLVSFDRKSVSLLKEKGESALLLT